MATGNEILAYTGNAELGSGSNPQIPVMDVAAVEKANNIVSDTAKNFLLMNHENNVRKYNQKIQDRNKQLELLEKGEIATGEVLDRDRAVLQSLKENSRQKFDEMIQNGGLDNQIAYKNYLDANQEFADAVTHAQDRYLNSKNIDIQAAKENIPYKRERIEKWKKDQDSGQAGDFWGNYGVYGEGFDRQIDDYKQYQKNAWVGGAYQANPTTTTTEKVVTGPKGTTVTQTTKPTTVKTAKGIIPIQGDIYKDPNDGRTYEITRQHYDYNKSVNEVMENYLKPSGKERADIDGYMNDMSNAPEYIANPILNHMVDSWNRYQTDNGIVEGDPRYRKIGKIGDKDNPIAIVDPQTGKRHINLSAPELKAMEALADIQGSYAPTSKKWLEDVDKFELEQQKVADSRRKSDLDRASEERIANKRIGLGYAELQENRDWHNFQKTLPKNQQDKADAISKEAIGFTDNLMTRIKDATDVNGFVDLTKLSSEDLKILGKGVKEKGQFTLEPMSSTSQLKFINGEIYEIDKDGNLKSGGKKTAQMIAGNRIMDQITSATGTEFGDFSILEKYYKNIQKEDKKSGKRWWGGEYPDKKDNLEIKNIDPDSGLPIFNK